MQRITRYPLLIRQVKPPVCLRLAHYSFHPLWQILNHSEAEDERRQISRALDSVQYVLNNINEAIREQEGRVRLEQISKNLYVGQG